MGRRLMNRFSVLGLAAVSLVAACAGPAPVVQQAEEKTSAARPNIVVILADDLGYADISSYGGKRIATPNIDRIAKAGVIFTDGYSAAPVCSVRRGSG